MKLVNKIKKLIWVFQNLHVGQTWKMYRRVKHPKSAHLHVYNYSLINLAKSATITLPENGALDINMLNIKRDKIRPCTLWMGDNSQLISKGFSMYEGAAIVGVDGGKLTLGHNS